MFFKLILNTIKLNELLFEREKLLSSLLIKSKKSLVKAPEGHLHAIKRGKYIQYHNRIDSSDPTGKYISKKNMKLACQLAQKEYDQKLIKGCEKDIKNLEYLKKHAFPLDFYQLFEDIDIKKQPLIVPLTPTDRDFINNWESVEYTHKEFDSEDTSEFYTLKNERVRSKSEVLIADTLSRFGIPYRYEFPIYISGIGTLHPDFFCLNVRTRTEVIFEHFGLICDSAYANSFVLKIQKYDSNGYHLGKNFIFTAESPQYPLSTRNIENLIKKYLL